MLTDTNHLFQEVRSEYLWKVPTEDTLGREINFYNDYNILDSVSLGKVKFLWYGYLCFMILKTVICGYITIMLRMMKQVV